jgi:Family of unknown function (DUF6516)
MLLSEYHAELAEVIGRYAHTDLIIGSELTLDARTSKLGVIKGALIFADGVRLFFTEYVDTRYRLEKLTYSYHCQDSDAGMLFRYDNAAHKPTLPYACHKHLPNGEIIEASVPDLSSVLDEVMERYVL